MSDLQYRDAYEFAVGHSVAAETVFEESNCCRTVRTCWIPQAEVERVAPVQITGVELSMDALSQLADGAAAKAKLGSFVAQYRDWIKKQRAGAASLPIRRKDTAKELLDRADVAANRIEQGIALLGDPQCLEAFKIANRAMAVAAKRRQGVMLGKDPATIVPKWRPFQLAFIVMNLPGISDPTHADRTVVDLLFFPTGGGKTEAYLGLAAFTLVLRRLRNPKVDERGTSGDLAEVWVRCECKLDRNLGDAASMQTQSLGSCDGSRPWLGPNTKEQCGEPNRLLIRTASNAYFTQQMSVISLPDRDETVKQAVDAAWEFVEAGRHGRATRQGDTAEQHGRATRQSNTAGQHGRANTGAIETGRDVALPVQIRNGFC